LYSTVYYTKGTATISATGADAVGVASVQFFVNGISIGSDSTAPYSLSWNTTSGSNGALPIKVRVFDAAGNYLESSEVSRTVDNEVPATTVSGVAPNYNYLSVDYTKGTATVTATASDNVAVAQVDFYVDSILKGSDTTSPYTYSWVTTGYTNAAHTIYAVARDVVTNTGTSATVSRTVDNAAPVVTSYRINAGAGGTGAVSVTLNNSITDTSPLVMRFQNTGGTWSGDETYAATKAWTLAATKGFRVVNAVFTDPCGNSVTVSDGIIYGTLTASTATLNSTTLGTVTVSWNTETVSGDSGTTTIRVFRRDYPTPGTYTYLAQTTTASTSLNVTVPQGSLYNFSVAIYNTSTDLGAYSNEKVGFTANVTIIYDDDDSVDTTLANYLKTILTTNIPASYPSSVTGTMPTWSVALFPEDLVSTTYAAANIVYGDPIIVTNGTAIYANVDQSRNATAQGKGVIGQGNGGVRLLDTVENNWGLWGYSGTSPTDIGYGESWVQTSGTIYGYVWTTSNTVWTSPLSSTSIPGHNLHVQLAYPGAEMAWYAAYRLNGAIPTDGDICAREDSADLHHFTVVRQGRFLQFGFTSLPNRPTSGWVFLANLVALMDNF
jgi:hypothetical protein